jgi:hypothetical protein
VKEQIWRRVVFSLREQIEDRGEDAYQINKSHRLRYFVDAANELARLGQQFLDHPAKGP